MRRARRGAFSLLEVILATAILLGCLVVLFELARLGGRQARGAEDLSTAQRICQTKINRILAGLDYPEEVQEEEVEGEPGWYYSLETEPAEYPGLIAVRVRVTQDLTAMRHPQEFALVRWIRDPEAGRGESLDRGLPLLPGLPGGTFP